jgi:hypothetical protein
MKNLESLLSRVQDIIINVKGEDRVLIHKTELTLFIKRIHGVKFKSKAQYNKLTKLSYLGGVNSSAKTEKGIKLNYHTYIIYLSPYKNIFGNVCANGEHCYKPCLNTSGRVKLDTKELNILRARYFKTVLWYVNRNFFVDMVQAEIQTHSKKHGEFLMVRLNGTSDLNPILFKGSNGKNILEMFPNVAFYDYTKIITRTKVSNKYANYTLTFSFNGYNWDDCEIARQNGLNIAVVFNGKQPQTYKGINTFSMDTTDLRPLDFVMGQIGYLKLKQTLNKEYDTKFIVSDYHLQ